MIKIMWSSTEKDPTRRQSKGVRGLSSRENHFEGQVALIT